MRILVRMLMVVGIFNLIFSCQSRSDKLKSIYYEELEIPNALREDLYRKIRNIEKHDSTHYDYFRCNFHKVIESSDVCGIVSGVESNEIGLINENRFSSIPIGYVRISNKIVFLLVYLSSTEYSFIKSKSNGTRLPFEDNSIDKENLQDKEGHYYEKIFVKTSNFAFYNF